MVVDSCYSGQMINDAKSFFNGKKHHDIYILTSTKAELSAKTGWKLLQMLIDHMVDGSKTSVITPTFIGTQVVENLVTSQEGQKAQFEILPNTIH